VSTLDRYDPDARAIATLRDQIAPEASDDELALFARVCGALALSPFADQIVLIGRYDSRANRKVHRHQITVAGRRALAERTGELVGIDGPEWTGPRDDRGELHWSELWTEDGHEHPPYAARVFVYRAHWVKPANGTAKWSEFRQTANDGSLLRMWRTMPAHMLGKVAESMALRRAFPNVIGAAVDLGQLDADVRHAIELSDTRDVVDDAPALDVDRGDRPDATRGDRTDSAPGPGAGGRPVPTSDQGTAHAVVAKWPTDVQAQFLERHSIATFGEVWPDDAVAEVMEGPL
jgi:RecT family